MSMELEKGLELIFSKELKQIITHSSFFFLLCFLSFSSSTSNAERTFVALHFVHPMTPKKTKCSI